MKQNRAFSVVIQAAKLNFEKWLDSELTETALDDYEIPDGNKIRIHGVILQSPYIYDGVYSGFELIGYYPEDEKEGPVGLIEIRELSNMRLQIIGHIIADFIGEYFQHLYESIIIVWPKSLPNEVKADVSNDNEPVSGKRKGGRPRDPINDWAYSEVHDNGRDPHEVILEWHARKKAANKLPIDPADSFKKAIKLRKTIDQERTREKRD